MALEYVGGNSAQGTGSTYSVSLTALTGGISSSAAIGDIVIVVTGWATSGGADADPTINSSGYTEAVADQWANDSREDNMLTAYKVLTTAETEVVVNGPNNAANGGSTVVHVWRGVNRTTPMDNTAQATSATNGMRANSTSITPQTAGAVILTAGHCSSATTDTSTPTAPSPFENTVYIRGDGSSADSVAYIASWSGWTSGAYDPAGWTGLTSPANSDGWCAYTLALRPAASTSVTGDGGGIAGGTAGYTTGLGQQSKTVSGSGGAIGGGGATYTRGMSYTPTGGAPVTKYVDARDDDWMDDANGYKNLGYNGYLFIDDGDAGGGWYGVYMRFHNVTVSGRPSSAKLKLYRGGDWNGANGTVRIRCQQSNTPATFSTGDRPYLRTYRTAYVEHTFPANATTQEVDVTSLVNDLLDAGYTYGGGASDAIVFGFRAAGWGLSSVSWRVIATDVEQGANDSEFTLTFNAGAVAGGAATVTLQKSKIVTADGGAVAGGLAGYTTEQATQSKVVSGEGGAVAGGTLLELTRTTSRVASGGGVTGGSSSLKVECITSGVGGGVTGGVAPYAKQQSQSIVASGGAIAGGVAIYAKQQSKSVAASGGAVGGGVATVAYLQTKSIFGVGGALGGGSATTSFQKTQSYSASGGAVTGGSATLTEQYSKTATMSGGGVAGGEAVVSLNYAAGVVVQVSWVTYELPYTSKKSASYSGIGGAVGGGASAVAVQKTYTAAGGGIAGGTAGVVTTLSISVTGEGGAVGGGSAAPLRQVVASGSGGAIAGGSGTVLRSALRASIGGGIAGGGAIIFVNDVQDVIGGALAGGSATLTVTRQAQSIGGAVAGGSATYTGINLQIKTVTMAGGAVAGGSFTTAFQKIATVSGTGGAVAGGSGSSVVSTTIAAVGGGIAGGAAAYTKQGVLSVSGQGGGIAGGSGSLLRSCVTAGAGGGIGGGSASTVKTAFLSFVGGAVAGGIAGYEHTGLQQKTVTMSGGAVAGGASSSTLTVTASGSGGAVGGGSATLAASVLRTASGGAVAGGVASYTTTQLQSYVVSMQGGAVAGGTTASLFAVLRSGIGGAVAGGAGTATYQKTVSVTGSGGAVAGGVSTYAVSRAYTMLGGAVAGGTASFTQNSVQLGQPDSDISDGTWTPSEGTDLFECINEDTASDADYIRSSGNPVNDECRIGLENVTDPTVHTDHVVRYRYRKAGGGTGTIDLTVSLYQGTMLIHAEQLLNIGTDFTTGSFSLTSGEAASITDYTALELRFKANKAA